MCIGIEIKAPLIGLWAGVVIGIGCRMKWVNTICLANKTYIVSNCSLTVYDIIL